MGKIYSHELVVSLIKLVLTGENLHTIVVVYVIKIVFHVVPLKLVVALAHFPKICRATYLILWDVSESFMCPEYRNFPVLGTSQVQCTSRLAVATISGCSGRGGPDLGAPSVACGSPVSEAWFASGVDHEDLPVEAEVVSVKHIEGLH
jgi:hypothetical protein